MTKFKATISKDFIEHRNSIIEKRSAGIRGADSEFPEFHQCIVDKFQTLNEGWEYDTYHEILGKIDYKQYSQAGVHISTHIQEQIKLGNIDMLGIWKWLPDNKWVELEEGMKVQYEILDYVDAKEAIKHLNEENRFTFPIDYDTIDE